MSLEWNQLKSMDTYVECLLTDLPRGQKVIPSLWTYDIKYNRDGSISKLKSRIVCDGSKQSNVEHCYSPTASFTGVRTLLALTSIHGRVLGTCDFSNAFLNSELNANDEPIYVKPPPRTSDTTTTVWKLIKSLYGLQQSSRNWYNTISCVLVEKMKFIQSPLDRAIFFSSDARTSTIISLYVDDQLCSFTTKETGVKFFSDLENLSGMKMTHKWSPDRFLGILIDQDGEDIVISQSHYVDEIIQKFEVSKTQQHVLPQETLDRHDLDTPMVDAKNYQAIVGSISWLTITRCDIGFARAVLSERLVNPNQKYLEAAINVLGYLLRTREYGIRYSKNGNPEMEIYCDASYPYGGGIKVMDSYIANITTLAGGWVDFSVKRLAKIFPYSTTESEFIASWHAMRTARVVRNVGISLGMEEKAMMLYNDNKVVTEILSKNYKCNKLRSIAIALHGLSHAIKIGIVTPMHIAGKDNIADLISKQRPVGDLKHLTRLLSKFMFIPGYEEEEKGQVIKGFTVKQSMSSNSVLSSFSGTLFAGEFWTADDGINLSAMHDDYFIQE